MIQSLSGSMEVSMVVVCYTEDKTNAAKGLVVIHLLDSLKVSYKFSHVGPFPNILFRTRSLQCHSGSCNATQSIRMERGLEHAVPQSTCWRRFQLRLQGKHGLQTSVAGLTMNRNLVLSMKIPAPSSTLQEPTSRADSLSSM